MNYKRILSEMKDISENPLYNEGIYVMFNSDNITKAYALIVGPKDTPYYGGFFLFSIEYPAEYPYVPPLVKFETLESRVRFNPNLYEDGKVCLSIINTWEGDGWRPENTIRSILLSILGLVLLNNPLVNEPGYNEYNNTNKKYKLYNNYVRYATCKYAILGINKYLVGEFSKFKIIVDKILKDRYKEYCEYLTQLCLKYEKKKNIYDPVYISDKVQKKLLRNYNEIYNNFIKMIK